MLWTPTVIMVPHILRILGDPTQKEKLTWYVCKFCVCFRPRSKRRLHLDEFLCQCCYMWYLILFLNLHCILRQMLLYSIPEALRIHFVRAVFAHFMQACTVWYISWYPWGLFVVVAIETFFKVFIQSMYPQCEVHDWIHVLPGFLGECLQLPLTSVKVLSLPWPCASDGKFFTSNTAVLEMAGRNTPDCCAWQKH